MFQIFNINFDNIYKKENCNKFIIMGVLFLALGTLSFFYKGIGIKIVSWVLAIALLFAAYLNLKNINELRRYAPKNEIAPFIRIQLILLVGALLLIMFPNKIQGIMSSLFGIYLIFSQLSKILKSRNNPYFKLGFWRIFELLFGFVLVFSPFFLSRFIASILSLLIIFLGVYLLSTGNRLRR